MNTTKSFQESYIESGEFYELLSEDEWLLRKKSIIDELRTLPKNSGPVIDVGAGTGKGLEIINQVLPRAEIIAIEPNPVMRIGLMTRIMSKRSLREMTTIFPGTFQNFTLPKKLSAVFMFGMIGYFDENSRMKIWKDLSKRLDRDGLIFIDTMMISKPEAVSLTRVVQKKIGSQFYEIWMCGDVIDENLERWTITHIIKQDDKEIKKFSISYGWYAFGLEKIEEEAKEFGLTFKKLSDTALPTGVLHL